jgi:peptidoglycan/LPS O-acetylase OafA/YrhL
VPERNRALDGLRGVAAMMVVVFHGLPSLHDWPEALKIGGIGVRIFFVLSGALITRILVSSRQEADRIGASYWSAWRVFAVRRALRILPLAYLAMAVTWLVGLPAMVSAPWWHLTFTNNFGLALTDGNPWPHGLGHFWTLAVEEQAYLLWPVLIFLLPLRAWPVVTLIAAISGTAARALLIDVRFSELPILFLDAFAIGGLIGWSDATRTRLEARWLVLAGVPLALGPVVWPSAWSFAAQELGLFALIAALVKVVWCAPTLPILSSAPLVWLGTISYGIYVWHLCGVYVAEALGVSQPVSSLYWYGGLGIGCATATWYLFERPILSLKRRFPGATVSFGHAFRERETELRRSGAVGGLGLRR